MTSSRPSLSALLYQAARQGILPLTSRCNVRCIFCSHGFNPPGVEVYHLSDRSLTEVLESLSWLEGSGKVVVGESITRIKEGEPLLYPHLFTVLEKVRRLHGQTPIQMTTNGSLLTKDHMSALKDLKVDLVVSLNSAQPSVRQQLMGEVDASAAPRAVAALAHYNLHFEGSLVAMPQITGYADLYETVCFLAHHGARCIRVLEAGFTRLTPAHLVPPPGTRERLEEMSAELSEQLGVPVILEPGLPDDLAPVVAGVMPASPAEQMGLRVGDSISSINGQVPFSRVEAFRLLGNPAPSVLRLQDGRVMEWDGSYREGVVMAYDLAPEDIEDMLTAVLEQEAKSPAALTSPRAASLLRLGLASAGVEFDVRQISPSFFGGNITCAGLLTVRDALEQLTNMPVPLEYDLLLLPGRAFDSWGRDLMGESYRRLEEVLGIPCRIVGQR